jgi:hypothetical protein
MANFAPGENRPVRTVFYDDLDTVRFSNDVIGKARKARDLTAMGNVMMGMVAGRIAAMLSQAQSYDNQLLLTLTSPEGSRADRDDMRAFLQLARTGFVQVTLMENGPAADPPDGERYTLMNMFRTSLTNPKFVLSGWPELNSNLDLRNEIRSCLDRAPYGRISDEIPAGIAARIEGLREFDWSLRRSPQGIRIVHQADKPLGYRINNMLRIMSSGDAARHAAGEVFKQAIPEKMNLNSRSSWYILIDRVSRDSDSTQDSAFRVLRDIVDLSYNAMISESLSNDGMSLSAGHEEAADTAARQFTPGQTPGKRWADLSPAQGSKGNWLRWSDIPDLLADLEMLSPNGRLTELRARQSEWSAGYETRHAWGVSIRIALPDAMGAAISGLATSLITSATPGQAAGVAVLTGTATIVARTPAVRALKERNITGVEERLISRDERRAIRTGAAGWLERIRRRQ